MLGLIKKDLLIIKNNLKTILIVFVLYIVMALNNMADISFIPSFISVMAFISTFSYDEYNKWDSYAVSLPKGKKSVVKSKYIATILITLVATIITALLSFIIGYVNNNINVMNIINMTFGSICGVILLLSILYPFIFKYGMEKGRIALFVMAFAISTVIILIVDNVHIHVNESLIKFLDNYWVLLALVITSTILFISYLISQKIYLKKEF